MCCVVPCFQKFIYLLLLQVVRKETGNFSETMTYKTWDVTDFIGQRARVRLVDISSGGWGHINFDDLKGDISCGEDES